MTSIQNDAYPHRREAARLLNGPYTDAETAGIATAHALLAIEQRLGELLEQQKTANLIAMLGRVVSARAGEIEWSDIEESIMRSLGMLDREVES